MVPPKLSFRGKFDVLRTLCLFEVLSKYRRSKSKDRKTQLQPWFCCCCVTSDLLFSDGTLTLVWFIEVLLFCFVLRQGSAMLPKLVSNARLKDPLASVSCHSHGVWSSDGLK